jgi:hypothetical protein
LAAVAAAIPVALAAGLAGAVLAKARTSRTAAAAGLVLLAVAVAGVHRLAPGQAGWLALTAGLIALGLREPPPIAEARLLWAVAPAFLVSLGWAAGGGGGQVPGALLAWAILGQLGQGLIWVADEGAGPHRLSRTGPTLGRMLELAGPFALLGLIGPLGLGATFLAGLAVAGLLVAIGQAWPVRTPTARTASDAGAALSRMAIAGAILLDRVGWPP